jgi:amino acid adenylation domain-containing protein
VQHDTPTGRSIVSNVYDRDASVPDLFRRQVAQRPDAIALELADKRLSYAELDAVTDGIAGHLLQLGVGPGDLVAVAAERSLTAIEAFLGVLKAGAAYVPLDPGYPRARLAYMLADTDAPVVLAQATAIDRLPPYDGEVVDLDRLLSQDGDLGGPPTPTPAPSAEDLAYVIYTSGSTGAPKGVEVSHRGIARLACGCDYLDLGPDETLLGFAPLAFDASTFEIWCALLTGSRLVLAPPGKLAPAELAEVIRGQGVTTAFLTSGLFNQFVDDEPDSLPCLRQLISGGDVLSPDHVARALAAMSPNSVLVNAYGPTENAVITTVHPMRAGDPVDSPIPIGRPIPHTSVYVLDEHKAAVAAGEAGELYTGGDGVARGYLGRPEQTAERFVPDPFAAEPGARMYRTGDRVRQREDGGLEFLGRVDRQMKIRGFRVEPGEIEVVVGSHPAVKQAVVIPREDVPGHVRLAAYVKVEDDSGRRERDWMHAFTRERLPEYMVPSAFVEIDEFPLTSNGKIDRAALPAPRRGGSSGSSARSLTPTETTVAAAWANVLHVENVGADDDFFDLGGDSLMALATLARLRNLHGIDLPLAAVFEHPTVAELAGVVDGLAAGPPPAALPPLRKSRGARRPCVSPAQAQACFLSELDPDSLAYQFQALIRFEGVLDSDALQRTLSEITRRHEILRTSFPKVAGEWVQLVHDPFPVRLETIDLRERADPGAALERLAGDIFRERMELDKLPLIRWELVRLSNKRHVLIHVEHHVVHDGWSFARFMSELTEIYGAFTTGLPSPLPDLEYQYRDFAAWQRDFGESEIAAEQLRYWSQQLADPPDGPLLPFDRPRPERQSFRGGVQRWNVPTAIAEQIRALAAAESVTLYMAALTAFLVQLHRYGGRQELTVGSGLANRRLAGTEELLGMFVNTAAMRFDMSGDPTVRELLRRVRAVTLEAYAHQELPFERVVSALAPTRAPGVNPFYQVLFSFHDSPLPDLRLPEVTILPEEGQSNGSAKADLNVVVVDRRVGRSGGGATPGDLTVVWEYDSDLFDEDTAARTVGHYGQALAAIVEDPERRLSELPLLPPGERQRLTELNPGPSAYERDASVAEVFEARVAETPDAVAIVAEGTEISYAELNRRANRLAHRLRALGVERGSLVGVCLERGSAAIVSLLAILKAGGGYVALDPTFPAERIQTLAAGASTRVICTTRSHASLLPPDSVQVVLDEIDLDDEPSGNPPASAGPEDLAYVAFTSGSTGRPKGVEVPQRGVVRLARSADYVELGPSETLLALAPLAFDASTFEIWGALLNGGRLAIAPPGALSPAEIADVLRRHDVTTLWLTAGLFHHFVDHHADGLSGVRQLLAGGDVLSPPHVERALNVLGPDAVLVNGYGPTETTTFACCHTIRPGDRIEVPVPIGRPIANARAYVLDERRQLVPIGVAGDLYIAGDGVARGYCGDAEMTAERFLPDPFATDPGARMYRSGDRVRWRNDGLIEFLGRADRQVKIRGFRVEPGEVEHILTRHPAVAEATMVAVDHGPNDRRLIAYLVPAAEEQLESSELRAFVAARHPAHLVPAEWIWLDRMPLNANGKVDRDALPAPSLRWGDAEPGRNTRAATPLERKLISIWQEVLGVRPVEIDDDFFDLGGHSLLAVELFAAIEQATGARLPLATIFEAPTVKQLAQTLAHEGWEAPWSPLVPLTTTGVRTPFFCVTAGDGNTVGFGALARRLGPDQPFYALQPRGLDGRRPYDARVELMARRYLREIRAIQPAGPYLLGGRCLGGVVAFEMAQRLTRAGEEVALLVVLDSFGPLRKARKLADGTPYDAVMGLAHRRAAVAGLDIGDPCSPAGTAALLAWLTEPAVAGTTGTVNRYLHEAYLARPDVQAMYPDLAGGDAGRLIDWCWTTGYREMAMTTRLLPPPTPAAADLEPPPKQREWRRAARAGRAIAGGLDLIARGRISGSTERREAQLQAVARAAADRYRADRYGGRITLVRSHEYADDPMLTRWYDLANEVDERTVRGTHRSMLREPDVESLAWCLSRCIDEVAS